MGAFIKAAGLDHIQIEIRIKGMYVLSEICRTTDLYKLLIIESMHSI